MILSVYLLLHTIINLVLRVSKEEFTLQELLLLLHFIALANRLYTKFMNRKILQYFKDSLYLSQQNKYNDK